MSCSSNDGDGPGYQDLSNRTPDGSYGQMGESTGRRTQSRGTKASPTVSHAVGYLICNVARKHLSTWQTVRALHCKLPDWFAHVSSPSHYPFNQLMLAHLHFVSMTAAGAVATKHNQ